MQALLQSQGIHHITLNGADRKTSIGFWQDVLGMKLIFEQPNLDDDTETHLYFDCGDGRTVTIFTNFIVWYVALIIYIYLSVGIKAWYCH